MRFSTAVSFGASDHEPSLPWRFQHNQTYRDRTMARPKVSSTNKRSFKLTLQLNKAELDALYTYAGLCGIAPSVVARERITKGRYPSAPIARIDLLTYTELKRIGVNLNQLTRQANTGIIRPDLYKALQQLGRQLDLITLIIAHDSQPKNW